MYGLDDDLLWQARNADLAGQYREADDLRAQWRKENPKYPCLVCGVEEYPGYHSDEDCRHNLLRKIMED